VVGAGAWVLGVHFLRKVHADRGARFLQSWVQDEP